MSPYERGQDVIVVRRKSRGRTATFDGKIVSIGPKWVTIRYELDSGYPVVDAFDVNTRCLKNFGAVVTFITPAELPTLFQEA